MNKRILESSVFYLFFIVIAFFVNAHTDFNITKLSKILPLTEILLYSISTALLIVLITFVLNRRSSFFRHIEIEFSKLILPISVQNTFFISSFSAIGEELIFRGIFFQQFGFFFSSILFGSIHFIPQKEFYPWTLFAICLGFILGGLFSITGSIVAPIVCHFLINFINILIIRHKFS